MMDDIQAPAAIVHLRWLSAAEGGRQSGPPTVPVYAANCTFPLGGEPETVPGWPATAEKFSVLIQKVGEAPDRVWICKIDFFALDLVAGLLRNEAKMLVMEGPKVVGHAKVTDVFVSVADCNSTE